METVQLAASLPRPGVLLVEDDEDARDIVTTYLERYGYPVIAARHGAEAWRLLKGASTPGLILLDLGMPVMDGFTLRRLLRADPILSTIPVVVISATYDARQASLALGAVAGFEKPLDLGALLNVVKQYC